MLNPLTMNRGPAISLARTVDTTTACNLFLVLIVGAVMLGLAWVGYVGSDDHSYARGALGWINEFPYVGKDHWTLRHTVVIPVALGFVIFGFREISLALPSAG